jgi:ribosomal protein S18 acetylase RimI-like enzyme
MSVRVDGEIDFDWADAFVDGDSRVRDRLRGYGRLISDPSRTARAAMIDIDGSAAAVGFGVTEAEWVGVFGMATNPRHRRRGAASTVLRALVENASADGATHAYLQVEADNVAARQLYESVGFVRSHGYHYRVLR